MKPGIMIKIKATYGGIKSKIQMRILFWLITHSVCITFRDPSTPGEYDGIFTPLTKDNLVNDCDMYFTTPGMERILRITPY